MNFIKIDVDIQGLDQAVRGLLKVPSITSRILGGGLRRVTQAGVKLSVPNTPILTGNLRHSIKASPVVVQGSEALGGIQTDGVDYATKMHEGFYNLGPVSGIQPLTPEGGVGRKFISRVVSTHGIKDFLTTLKEWSDECLNELR